MISAVSQSSTRGTNKNLHSAKKMTLPLLLLGALSVQNASQGQNYVFERTFGATVLNRPNSVAVDTSGNAYVADTLNNQIVKFDQAGNVVWTASGPLGTITTLRSPSGIALDSLNNVYVANSGNNSIVKFDSSGAYLSAFGGNGIANDHFNFPFSVKIDANGNIFVADTLNDRVQKFDANANYLQTFGSNGSGNGQLRGAADVAIDSQGFVYVADLDNARIMKFDSSGNYVSQFGNTGPLDTQTSSAGGITIDSRGDVFVSAPNIHDQIQKYSPVGAYLGFFGSFGTQNGQFYNCEGLSFDSTGRLFVADYDNNRIQVFIPVVVNVDASVTVFRGGLTFSHATQRFHQKVRIKNMTAKTITGPISLVLQNLSSNATLYNPTGSTMNLSPVGSPYSEIAVDLAGHKSVVFTLEFINPTKAPITYSPSVYAGPGYH